MSISIKKVLLATDFSDCAAHAQRYALALAVPLSAQLDVLHVVKDPDPLPSSTGLTFAPPPNLLPQIIKNAETQLDATIAKDRERYPRIQCAIRAGDPVRQIYDYARTHNVDMIVLGTHGRTGLSHLITGSVAEKIARMASCPVLTVHADGQVVPRITGSDGRGR